MFLILRKLYWVFLEVSIAALGFDGLILGSAVGVNQKGLFGFGSTFYFLS